MAVCGDWFRSETLSVSLPSSPEGEGGGDGQPIRILLFNCMPERDPSQARAEATPRAKPLPGTGPALAATASEPPAYSRVRLRIDPLNTHTPSPALL